MGGVEGLALLTAGSTRYHDSVGRSAGSAGKLCRSELAGLLSGLGSTAVNMALAKYMGDVDAERILIEQVKMWAYGVAAREHWRIVAGRPCVSNMSALAVFDVVRPNWCGLCGGGGYVGIRYCKRCRGDGFERISGRVIANAIGIDECNYRRVWRGRYAIVFGFVQDIDFKVKSFVLKNGSKKVLETAAI